MWYGHQDIRQACLSLCEIQEQLHQDPNNEELGSLEQQSSNTLRLLMSESEDEVGSFG